MSTKEQIIQALQDLPEDATVEDAMERLFLLYKIETGILQAEAGQKATQTEARDRMKQWLP